MEAWTAFLNQKPDAPRGKRGRGDVAPDESAKVRELVNAMAKLSLKTAQDVRVILAVTFLRVRVSADDDAYKTVKAEFTKHAERTRDKSGHDEGGPDGPALVALMLLLVRTSAVTDEEKAVIEAFLARFPPPTSPEGAAATKELQKAVPCCKVQKMHSSAFFKLYVRLPYDKAVEQLLEKHLCARGCKQLLGQAPRGALERRIQDLLKDLQLDSDE